MLNLKPHEFTGALPLKHIVEIGVDKLKFGIRSEYVDDSFAALLQDKFELLRNKPDARSLTSQRYAFKQRLHVRVGDELVLIECQPNAATYPWAATVEFNPNPYLRKGDKAIAQLGSFFRFLFGYDAQRILSQAFISMLHVNIDYDMNPLEGTLVSAKGKRSGAKVMYDFDGHGVLGSLYVGVLNSDRRLAIYDKAAEVLHRELGPAANKILAALASDGQWNVEVSKLKEQLTAPVRWRLEVRYKRAPKDAVSVSDIADFASCFDGIRFLHLPPDVHPFNTSLGRLFIANARRDGIPLTLRALDANERRQFERKLAKLQEVDWFNAELLQDAISQVINRLAPLFVPSQHHLRVRRASEDCQDANTVLLASRVGFRRTGPVLTRTRVGTGAVFDISKPR